MNYSVGICTKCNQSTALAPLHYERGGPLTCAPCAMTFHAGHTRRRRAGRVILKAMELYLREGGDWSDLEWMRLTVGPAGDWGRAMLQVESSTKHKFIGVQDPRLGLEEGDLTTELLDDALTLTHPDHHPPERRDLAERVTRQLLALRPFVFPAPKPEAQPEIPPDPAPRDGSEKSPRAPTADPSRPTYPCESCADEIPYFYCDPCKREWDRRQEESLERERVKARAQRRARRLRRLQRLPKAACPACGAEVTPTRKDKKHCSPACRQAAFRRRRNGLKSSHAGYVLKPLLAEMVSALPLPGRIFTDGRASAHNLLEVGTPRA